MSTILSRIGRLFGRSVKPLSGLNPGDVQRGLKDLRENTHNDRAQAAADEAVRRLRSEQDRA